MPLPFASPPLFAHGSTGGVVPPPLPITISSWKLQFGLYDSILIMYDDTTSSYLALLTDNAGTGDGVAFTDITITNLLEFTDVAAAESFLTTSFAIIA